MQLARPMKYLTFTVPAVIGIALVVACADGTITAPQKFQVASPFADRNVSDDADGVCVTGELTEEKGKTADYDQNGNDLVCIQTDRHPPKKK